MKSITQMKKNELMDYCEDNEKIINTLQREVKSLHEDVEQKENLLDLVRKDNLKKIESLREKLLVVSSTARAFNIAKFNDHYEPLQVQSFDDSGMVQGLASTIVGEGKDSDTTRLLRLIIDIANS